MKEYITLGDRVNVYWENVNAEFNVELTGLPQNVGATYIFKRKDGTVFESIIFCKMEKQHNAL